MIKPVAFIGTRSGYDGIFQAADDLGIPIAGWFDRYYAGNTAEIGGYPILGSDLDISQQDCERYDFFLASHYSGDPVMHNPAHNGQTLRLERIKLIRERNLPLINLITPSAYIHPTVVMGQGVYVGHNAIVRAHCVLGDFSYLCHGSGLGHHVHLEENVVILAHGVVGGDVLFKRNSMVGINATVVNTEHNQPMTIGENTKIAAGAAVYKSVEDNKFVSVQGRVMKKIDGSVA